MSFGSFASIQKYGWNGVVTLAKSSKICPFLIPKALFSSAPVVQRRLDRRRLLFPPKEKKNLDPFWGTADAMFENIVKQDQEREKMKKMEKNHPEQFDAYHLDRLISGRRELNKIPIGNVLTAKEIADTVGLSLITLEVRRFSLQTAKGKQISWGSLVAAGNKNGAIGYGMGKAPDVADATRKALTQAANNLEHVVRYDRRTIPHAVEGKAGKIRVFLRPCLPGHGLVAHSMIQSMCKLAGIRDISVNLLGPTRNHANVVRAFFDALSKLQTPEDMAMKLGKSVFQVKSDLDIQHCVEVDASSLSLKKRW